MSLFKSVAKGFSSLGSAFTGKGGDVYNGIGSALNKITGSEKAMNQTYKQQISAMNKQNAYNTMMWNLQNEYNSPSAQLARMADAGIEINPTSYALGTGNLSNTAALVGSDSGFAGSPSPSGNPITALMGMAQGIQNVKESQARAKLTGITGQNAKIQGQNALIQGKNLGIQGEHTKIENDIMRHNLGIARKTKKPVNYTPTMQSDPINYVGGILGDYFTTMLGF